MHRRDTKSERTGREGQEPYNVTARRRGKQVSRQGRMDGREEGKGGTMSDGGT